MQNSIINSGTNPIGTIINDIINTHGIQILFSPFIALLGYYKKITDENRLEPRYFISGAILFSGIITSIVLPIISPGYSETLNSWFGFLGGNIGMITLFSIPLINWPLSGLLDGFANMMLLWKYGNKEFYLRNTRRDAIAQLINLTGDDVQIMFNFLLSCYKQDKESRFSLQFPPTREILNIFMVDTLDYAADLYRKLLPYYYAYAYKNNRANPMLSRTLFNKKNLEAIVNVAHYQGVPKLTEDYLEEILRYCLTQMVDKNDVEKHAEVISLLIQGAVKLAVINVEILQETNKKIEEEAAKLAITNEVIERNLKDAKNFSEEKRLTEGKSLTEETTFIKTSPNRFILHSSNLTDIEMAMGDLLEKNVEHEESKHNTTPMHKVRSYHTLDKTSNQLDPTSINIDPENITELRAQIKAVERINNDRINVLHRRVTSMEKGIETPLTTKQDENFDLDETRKGLIKFHEKQKKVINEAQKKIPKGLHPDILEQISTREKETPTNAQGIPIFSDAQSARSSGLQTFALLANAMNKDNKSVSSGTNSAVNSSKSETRRLGVSPYGNVSPYQQPRQISAISTQHDPLLFQKPIPKKSTTGSVIDIEAVDNKKGKNIELDRGEEEKSPDKSFSNV